MTDHLWASTYLPNTPKKAVVAALKTSYETAGYTAYDPFPGGTGTPSGISFTIRLFVARPENGWTRILGTLSPEVLKALAEKLNTTLINVWIDESESKVEAIGQNPLTAFLKPDKTADDLTRAEKITLTDENQPVQGELMDLAKNYGVQGKHIEKLLNKTSKTLLNKLEGGEAAQSEAMASISNQFSWNTLPARRVQAQMECLTVPENWREPSFKELALAYPIARLLEKDVPLLPGDEELLDKVEFPLDYTPVYYAK